jgi:hypothetical protein
MIRATVVGPLAAYRGLGQPTAAERLFTFRQSLWLNLHHFLHVLGRARNNEADSRRGAAAAAIGDGQRILDLPEQDRIIWDKGVAAYANSVSKKDLIFDRSLSLLTKSIGDVEDSVSALPTVIEAEVRAALWASAPIYRRLWWAGQSSADQQRTVELQKLIAQYGDAIAGEVTARIVPNGRKPVSMSMWSPTRNGREPTPLRAS